MRSRSLLALAALMLAGTPAWSQGPSPDQQPSVQQPPAPAPDPNTAANMLVVETVGSVERARTTTDLSEAAASYRKASDNLARIVKEFPGSDVAVRISTGQQIGKLDLERLKAEGAEVECLVSADPRCLITLALDGLSRAPLSRRSHALQQIGLAQLAVGDRAGGIDTITKAIAVVRETEKRSSLPLAHAARALAQADRPQALAILRAMTDAGVRDIGYVDIANDLAKAGDRDGAHAVLKLVSNNGGWARVLVLARRIEVEHLLGDDAAATKTLAVLAKAIDGGTLDKAMDMTSLARAQKALGMTRDAAATCVKALKLATTEKYPALRVSKIADVVRAAAELELDDQTFEAAAARLQGELAAERSGNKTDATLYSSARGSLVSARLARGDMDGAQAVLAGLSDTTWRSSAVIDLMLAKAKAGDRAAALAAITDLTQTDDRNRAFGRLAIQSAESGQTGQALLMIRDLADPVWRAIAIATIVKGRKA